MKKFLFFFISINAGFLDIPKNLLFKIGRFSNSISFISYILKKNLLYSMPLLLIPLFKRDFAYRERLIGLLLNGCDYCSDGNNQWESVEIVELKKEKINEIFNKMENYKLVRFVENLCKLKKENLYKIKVFEKENKISIYFHDGISEDNSYSIYAINIDSALLDLKKSISYKVFYFCNKFSYRCLFKIIFYNLFTPITQYAEYFLEIYDYIIEKDKTYKFEEIIDYKLNKEKLIEKKIWSLIKLFFIFTTSLILIKNNKSFLIDNLKKIILIFQIFLTKKHFYINS